VTVDDADFGEFLFGEALGCWRCLVCILFICIIYICT
jgi:hypothetical protein